MKNKALNAETMKYRNYRRLMEELRTESISRSELARRTGLTRAAIGLQVDTLAGQGLIEEGAFISLKSSGRSSIELKLKANACYCIGVAIRRDYFAAGIFDFLGRELYSETVKLAPPYHTREAAYAKLFDIIDRGIAEARPAGQLIGIGVGAPGPIDVESGTVDNPTNLRAFNNTPVAQLLGERYHSPVTLKNDACALALCELYYGVRNKYDSFLVIEVTGGLGAGLILNRRLQSSQLGNGCEIGHTTIDINGKRCICGNVGCSELYAAINSIVEYAAGIDPRFNSWQAIVDLAMEGCRPAIEVVKKEAFYLSSLTINMLNSLDLEAMILNGRDITYRPELLLSYMRKDVEERKLIKKGASIDILTSSIAHNPDILSAANLAIDSFISSPEQLKSFCLKV